MDVCPNRGFSWVLRESPFPLRSRGSGGLPQPPGANTRTPFLPFLGDPYVTWYTFSKLFCAPPPSLLALYLFPPLVVV